jgi:ABC-type iron transport system FetAB permease component
MTEEKADGYPWLTLRTLLAIVVMGLYMMVIWSWTAWDYTELVIVVVVSYHLGTSVAELITRGWKPFWEYWLILANTALTTLKKLLGL